VNALPNPETAFPAAAPAPRRVLMVNKFYYPRGGAEHYMLRLAELLAAHGVESLPFAMHHPRNLPAPTERFFVSEVDFEHPPAGMAGRAGVAGRAVYSFEARRQMTRLLEAEHVDLAHVHNIYHQLSPSLLAPLRRRGIPVVMTVHDFKLVCPVYSLMTNGEVCERCVGGSLRNAVKLRCNRGSLAGSALLAGETWVHRRLGLYDDGIDVFVSPSRFARDRLVAGGYPADRIQVVPNFVDSGAFTPGDGPGDAFVYFGRLSREKGPDVLIRAAAGTGLRVRLVGEGPAGDELRELARELGVDADFLGFRTGAELADVVRSARAVVAPSRCHDNCPLAVIEAMAWGRPVIGSRVGGIPELVRDGREGMLVPAGDPDALRAAMAALDAAPAEAARMGARARRRVEQHYSAPAHLGAIEDAYALAAERRRGGTRR
jgi:glycosyltransferase involved in cell wall biosynthesis